MAELVLVRDPWRNIWGPELSNVLVFHLFVFVCEIFSFFPLHICDQYIWQWINQKFWNLYECLLKITGRTLTNLKRNNTIQLYFYSAFYNAYYSREFTFNCDSSEMHFVFPICILYPLRFLVDPLKHPCSHLGVSRNNPNNLVQVRLVSLVHSIWSVPCNYFH